MKRNTPPIVDATRQWCIHVVQIVIILTTVSLPESHESFCKSLQAFDEPMHMRGTMYIKISTYVRAGVRIALNFIKMKLMLPDGSYESC